MEKKPTNKQQTEGVLKHRHVILPYIDTCKHCHVFSCTATSKNKQNNDSSKL